MSTININCVDQALSFVDMPLVSSGDQNIDKVQFNFCSLWDGFVKVAVFFVQKEALSYSMIGADGIANIPNSIMASSGNVFIGVTGINGSNQVRTSNLVTYRIEEGVANAIDAGEFPDVSEQEDIFQQILAMCSDMQEIYLDIVDNLAYLRLEDANEFEYDENKIQAKVENYVDSATYKKADIYTKNEVDTRISSGVSTGVSQVGEHSGMLSLSNGKMYIGAYRVETAITVPANGSAIGETYLPSEIIALGYDVYKNAKFIATNHAQNNKTISICNLTSSGAFTYLINNPNGLDSNGTTFDLMVIITLL